MTPIFRARSFCLVFVVVMGCGYNPESSTDDASAGGASGGDAPVLSQPSKDASAPVDGGAGKPQGGQSGSAGVTGTSGPSDAAGAAGIGGLSDAAGDTGIGGQSGASGGLDTGGATDTGGVAGPGGSQSQGGTSSASTFAPDAGVDLSPDVSVAVSCPQPSAPTNGKVSVSSLEVKGVATYTCSGGYTPSVSRRNCQANGTWDGADPVCNLVDCGRPPAVENATVSAPLTTYNNLATYTCDPNFTFSAGSSRNCLGDGTWSLPAPICVRRTVSLTVKKVGSGLGSINNASGSIQCGNTCQADVEVGIPVTLTASPAAGQTFVGWEGTYCKGKSACTFSPSLDTVVRAVFSPPPNTVFVTSTEHTANLGGLAGADTICATRAQAAGLAGTYKAWLSTSTVDAKTRLGAASGWARPDGKPVLSLIGDLQSNRVFYPPSLDESGKNQGSVYVFTGTRDDGTGATPKGTYCTDWTSTTATDSIFAGFAGSSNAALTSDTVAGCALVAHIYCFGIDRTAFVALDTPPQGRRAFATGPIWTPGKGIASADTLCQQEASKAGLAGTFKALLTPTGASAASRFAGDDTPWYRMDGLPLAASAHEFLSASKFDVGPNLTADGGYMFPTFSWTGAPTMTTVGVDGGNCMDWASATDIGYQGEPGDSDVARFFGFSSISTCEKAGALVCLQI